MAIRLFGIKKEKKDSYGKPAVSPDWHQQVSKLSASLNAEPVTMTGGSRMIRRARAGAVKPTSSVEGNVDMKRIGHYMYAFLGNYGFTAGSNGGVNTHEFWGGENTSLPSFTLWESFDLMEKTIVGGLLDSLKLEVSEDFMTLAADWIYKDEEMNTISEDTFDEKTIEGAIPLMFYDVSLELDSEVPPGIVSSFSFEGKNNLNQDKTIGLGSRMPQRKASAQNREISLSFVSTLEKDTLKFIQQAEYGEEGNSPSECKLYKLPIKLIASICEDRTDRLEIFFPECLFSIEYEASESDEIEVTFNLQAMGTAKAEITATKNEETGNKISNQNITTDMYVKLVNNQSQITADTADGTSTVTVTVTDKNNNNISGATVKLNSRDSKVKNDELTGTTDDKGTATISNVPYARYSVSVTGYTVSNNSYFTANSETEKVKIKLN